MNFNQLLILFEGLYRKSNGYTTMAEIRNRFCPNAQGIANGDLIFPTPEILQGNDAVNSWCTMIQFYNVKHLDYWFRSIHQYNPDMLMNDYMASIGAYGCQEHELPYIQYVARPEQVTVKKGTMLDLIHEYNMSQLVHFATYLYSLVIMGVFINDLVADNVLQIQNPQEFIAARLFQGELDFLFTGSRGITSVFMPLALTDGSLYNSEPFYQSIEGELNQSEFEQLLRQEKEVINSSTFLGNETAQIITMKEALELPETYSDYLKRHSPFQKVGPRVFESIALGSSKRKEIPNQNYVNRERLPPIQSFFTGKATNTEAWAVAPAQPVEATNKYSAWSSTGGGELFNMGLRFTMPMYGNPGVNAEAGGIFY